MHAYLIYDDPGLGDFYFDLPGFGFDFQTFYQSLFLWDSEPVILPEEGMLYVVRAVEGPGEDYDEIHIIRIEQSDEIDRSKRAGSIVPEDLDVSNYQ